MSDDMNSIKTILTTAIQAKVVEALNTQTDTIDKLVKAALSQPVDDRGQPGGYSAKTPFLDWLVGEEIRRAARIAVQEELARHRDTIAAMIAPGLSDEAIVGAFGKAVASALRADWRINVEFHRERN